MKNAVYSTLISCLLKALFATHVWAGDIRVVDAHIRETLPGQPVSAAYFTIQNAGAQELLLRGVTSVRIPRIEIHQHRHEGDMMRMRQVDSVLLPPGQAVLFESGGYHLMLMDLQAPLRVGEEVELELQFDQHEPYRIRVPVFAIAASIQAGRHKHEGHSR